MGLWSRKFRIGLISLGVVLSIFLLYSLISKTPRIEIDTGPELVENLADGNIGHIDGEVGEFGRVGVGPVQKARYVHLNEQKQVDWELGFDELVHEAGNEWEVKKPYLNRHQPDVVCYITSERGRILVESAGGRPHPKVAEFTGNVVAHFVPVGPGNAKEGFLYLDDITFLSTTSKFSTPGPVKYLSEDAQMLGRGLEFIYNDYFQRIDLLRIVHLESLSLKSEQSDFSSRPAKDQTPADANSRSQRKPPEKPVEIDDSTKAKSISDPNTQDTAQKQAQRYRCVFNKSVILDSPEQLIFALEKISIRNIFRQEESAEQSDKADPCSTGRASEPIPENAADMQNELEPNSAGSPNSPVIQEQPPVDIVVTCDDGFVLIPMDVNSSDTNSPLVDREELLATAREELTQLKEGDERNLFIAQRIDYCAATQDTVAVGPSELKFYARDLFREEANDSVVPVTITTQKKAQFLPTANQALFEGGCVCTMLREDANGQQKYTLSAPKITVDLAEQEDEPLSSMANKIEHLSALGPTTRFSVVKMAEQELLGGFEVECAGVDYDARQGLFLASGPGEVRVDNTKVPEPNEDAGKFSMRRKSYSIVESFETLKYFVEKDQIIAEAGGQGVVVHYFPIVDSKYDRHITITSSHIEAFLYEAAGGQTELSSLHATDGVTYVEEDVEFKGSKLFYDAVKGVITVEGDDSQPCILNGSLVDKIEYDLKTGRKKFKLVGPGTLQRK
ncbi:MAG: hypothetical protein AMJ75_07820 [Phycisphaerae bacterium SM1_79]|nr:MAG: hypothetical protein AMJ75_07820 [Phycisphaerae bacterium SM1_79]